MSKISFVVPPIQMDEVWGQLSEEGSVLPPLGIAILASLTRGKGFETNVCDFMAERTPAAEALSRVLSYKPDYLGITATTDMLASAVRFASEIKKEDGGITILIGGPHISAVPVETMQMHRCFDYGFVGESESTLIDFLRVHAAGGDVSQVKGLVVRRGDGCAYTGQQQQIEDMDSIPLPAWDLLPDIKKYYRPAMINYKREPVTSLVTSRGCAGRCIFCDASVFGRKVRAYSAGYVINAIKTLMKDYGIKEVCFYDDTFVAFKKRLTEICNAIIDGKLDITWACNARVNLVDPDTLRLMKKAGCWQVAYGIESGSQRVLDALRKDIKIDQIKKAVKWTKEAGISTKGFFMIGSPSETKEDIEMTKRLMLEIDLDDALVEYFTPYPGTEVFAHIDEYGALNAAESGSGTFSITFVPKGLTVGYLKEQFSAFYRSFYLRPRIVLNYMKRFGSARKMLSLVCKFIKFSSSGSK